MEKEQELLCAEIVNRGVEGSGPYAGSLSFSVRVRRGLPDFATSVNLKYVKLGYAYLLSHALYFFTAPPLLVIICSATIGKLTWHDFLLKWDFVDAIFLVGFMGFVLYIYFALAPPPTYLVNFACYRPPNELKISKEEFIRLAKNSGKFNDASIKFQQKALKNSGIGDESYMPRVVFRPDHKITLTDGREEAARVMFGAVDDLFAATKILPKDIRILVVNCGILNTTPSLSSMVINHYKLSHSINSFNLGGMGCAGGIIAVDVAKDLLSAYPGSYAVVVSTEAVSCTWYDGNEKSMLLPNCFFRMGAAAMLLSSCRLDRWRSKYEFKQVVRTHKGMDERSFKSICLKEDREGRIGLSVSKDILEVGGLALKANITNYKLHDFKHVCVLASSKRVLDEIQNNLELTDEHMEASRKTLERFGNTSSSSIWYELAYLEDKERVKRGDRVCQIGFGSGFKCHTLVWKALANVRTPKVSPWINL